jgi:hypothetical protein
VRNFLYVISAYDRTRADVDLEEQLSLRREIDLSRLIINSDCSVSAISMCFWGIVNSKMANSDTVTEIARDGMRKPLGTGSTPGSECWPET